MRAAVGDEFSLAVDANNAWHRTAFAPAASSTGLGIAWFEEPVLTHDRAGSAALAAALDTPISGYETESLVSGFRDLIETRAVDIVQPDVIWTGGITACRRVAALAHAAGLACVPHVYSTAASVVSNLHFIASIPNSVLLEFDQNPNSLRTELLTRPVEPDAGALVHLGDSPGLGTGFDHDTLSALRQRPAAHQRVEVTSAAGRSGTVVVTDCDHGTMAPAGRSWTPRVCRGGRGVPDRGGRHRRAADAAVL